MSVVIASTLLSIRNAELVDNK